MAGEFRFDPMTRQWVSIVGHRQARPNLPNSGCPFCVGGLEAPQDYDVAWFTNRWPALAPGEPTDFAAALTAGETAVPAVGTAEVILFSSDHDASLATLPHAQVRKVVDLWAQRTEALYATPEIEYALIFENRGAEVGATIPHPHGQIYAFGFVPPEPALEAAVSREHGCGVCSDLEQELAAAERIVFESATWVVYVPFAAPYSYGVRIVARRHLDTFVALTEPERDGLADALKALLGSYDDLWRDDRKRSELFPYLLWFHQAPKTHDGEYHLHAHTAPPQRSPGVTRYVASGELGSGVLSNPISPEVAAGQLRFAIATATALRNEG